MFMKIQKNGKLDEYVDEFKREFNFIKIIKQIILKKKQRTVSDQDGLTDNRLNLLL